MAATKKKAASKAKEPEKTDTEKQREALKKIIPDWYKPIDWESAVIDLTDYGFGEVVLRDPVLSFVGKEITMSADADQTEKTEGQKQIVKLAAELRSYVDCVRMDEGPGYIHAQQAPKDNDKGEAWVSWVKTFKKKPLDRIRAGIQLFVNDAGVEFSKN